MNDAKCMTFMSQVKTVKGAPVIIFTTKNPGEYPIMGARYDNESWIPACWCIDGKYPSINEHVIKCDLDLDIDDVMKWKPTELDFFMEEFYA